jgi:opacity protein-like surface antigen
MSALLFGLQLAVSAETGIGENTFSIGPRAAYFTPKDAVKGLWAPGVQARLRLLPGLALEGSIDYRRNDFRPLTTIKTYPVQASLLGYVMQGGVVSPFLLSGIGWYYTLVKGPFGFSDTTSRFGLHIGAGLEVKLKKSLSLDGTYRYVWLESVQSRDLNALNKTYQDSGSIITIALNFLF